MSLDPSWRPAEDEVTIFSERTWLAGMTLSAVAYGIVFTIFLLSLKQLIRTTTKYNYIQRLTLMIYSTLIFILGSLIVGSGAKMTQLSFIDYRSFPGGPAAFNEQEFSTPINEISIFSSVFVNWLAGAMVIYRYMVIYKSSRQFPLWVIMIIPVLAYMTSISLSVFWLIQVSAPSSSPFNRLNGAINFTAPYLWVSVSLNITMTIAICSRLLLWRRRIARILGPKSGSVYTSVVTMIVESSLLQSAFALLFLIPFALKTPIQNVFIQLIGEAQIIPPLLIIYHVAYGSAWVDETSQVILGTNDTQHSGVQVELEFSDPDEMPSNHHPELEYPGSETDIPGRVEPGHKMGKFRA